MVYPTNGTELTTTSSANLSNGTSSKSAQTSSDNHSAQPQTSTHTYNLLKHSFAVEFSEDLAPKSQQTPIPIYEGTTETNENIVSDVQDINLQLCQNGGSWKEKMHFLLEGPFYRSWLLKTTACYSALVFWAFFPTYLYYNRADINLKKTCLLSGCVAIGGLLTSLFSQFLPSYGEKRKNVLAAFCFTGAIGFFCK